VTVESIRKSAVELKVLDLCERYLKPQGFLTVDVDCIVSGRSTVRIFVEPIEKGPKKVSEQPERTSISDCKRVTELMGPVLDVESVVPGSYDLEVASPGLDRRLRTQADFANHEGREVKLRLAGKVEGLGGHARGRIGKVLEGRMLFHYEGKELWVALENIGRANLVWEFEKRKG